MSCQKRYPKQPVATSAPPPDTVGAGIEFSPMLSPLPCPNLSALCMQNVVSNHIPVKLPVTPTTLPFESQSTVRAYFSLNSSCPMEALRRSPGDLQSGSALLCRTSFEKATGLVFKNPSIYTNSIPTDTIPTSIISTKLTTTVTSSRITIISRYHHHHWTPPHNNRQVLTHDKEKTQYIPVSYYIEIILLLSVYSVFIFVCCPSHEYCMNFSILCYTYECS